MDQLKTHFAVAVKYGFWIASALVLLVSLGIWYTTTSALDDENNRQTQKIQTSISTVKSVQGELPTTPNSHSHEKMKALIAERQDQVLTSWEDLYDRQKDILVWPKGVFNDELVDEFVGKMPIEVHVAFPTAEADELETTLRKQYATYIKNVLPSIAEIAKTEWTAEFEQSSTMGGGMMDSMGSSTIGFGNPEADVDITGETGGPLVEWDTGSQSALLKDLFPWRGQMPSTLDVYYSQENLWILRQLLQIINEVNGAARQPYQAKIHQISKIGIGRSVKENAGHISKPGQGGSGGMMGDMGMLGDMMDDMDGMGDMMDMGGDLGGDGMGTAEAVDPADNRYLNADFEPIDGSTLRGVLTSDRPNDASLAVAKRIPVMMKLNMDQRAVHELVAACGSADLMVGVNQVRVLPKNESSSDMGGMSGMDMEGDGGMEMEMGGMGGMGGMSGMGGGSAGIGKEEVEEFPLDMSVEIYGIINIYNPPDAKKLLVDKVTQDTVIDGALGSDAGQAVVPTQPTLDPVTPAATDPAATDPAATDPAATDPAATDPAATDPATTDPATTDPGALPDATTPTPGGSGTPADNESPPAEGNPSPPVAANAVNGPTPAILSTQP